MDAFINSLGTQLLSWILLAIGFWLVGWGVVDIGRGLGGTNKEWTKALTGIAVGAVGGLLMFWGASALIAFFRNYGNSIPHQ